MYSIFIFIYVFMINVLAKTNNKFIVEYFDYKKVSSIAGFSCNNNADDMSLFKDFNKKGILVALHKLKSETKINLVGSTKHRKIGIFLDIRCYDVNNIASLFSEAAEYRMFDEIHYWLVLGTKLGDILALVDDRTFGLSTEFVIVVISDVEDYQLYDAYNIEKDRGMTLNITLLGKWNEGSGLNISLKQAKLARRSNMHRFVLRATFFKCTYKPDDVAIDEYLSDYANPTKDARFKFGFHILRSFADLYNFSLKAIESTAWEEGDTLGPIAKALMKNQTDITGTPLNVNHERSNFIKFVHEDWRFRTFFIFRNPQSNEVKADIIFRSFDNKVWCLILLLIILSIIIYAIILQFEQGENTITTISNSSLITIGALCQQGTDMKMKYLSTRIVFFFIMIFSILIYNYYSACIVSTRLAQPIYKINDSLNELTKLNLKMSSEWMVYIQFFFNIQNWEIQLFYHNYWLKLPESLRFMEPEVGIRLVQKGGFAYHTHPDISYPYIEKLFDNHEICELNEVHLGRPTNTAFGVNSNSSFQELSRIGLTKIAEIGLRHRETVRWQFKKPYCRKDLLSASSITIYEFAPYLIMLMMGMLLAFAGFIIELVISYRNKHVEYRFIKIMKRLLIREIQFKEITYNDVM